MQVTPPNAAQEVKSDDEVRLRVRLQGLMIDTTNRRVNCRILSDDPSAPLSVHITDAWLLNGMDAMIAHVLGASATAHPRDAAPGTTPPASVIHRAQPRPLGGVAIAGLAMAACACAGTVYMLPRWLLLCMVSFSFSSSGCGCA